MAFHRASNSTTHPIDLIVDYSNREFRENIQTAAVFFVATVKDKVWRATEPGRQEAYHTCISYDAFHAAALCS